MLSIECHEFIECRIGAAYLIHELFALFMTDEPVTRCCSNIRLGQIGYLQECISIVSVQQALLVFDAPHLTQHNQYHLGFFLLLANHSMILASSSSRSRPGNGSFCLSGKRNNRKFLKHNSKNFKMIFNYETDLQVDMTISSSC